MTSFIDMMANDVWTEADIKTRLHSMIRAEFSAEAEEEISRAIMGATLKQHQLTPSEIAAIGRFKALTDTVAAVGVAARADWALLQMVMAHEQAAREARAAHDAAQARVDAGEMDVFVPPLLSDPVEGSAIYAVWRMRNPAPAELGEVA